MKRSSIEPNASRDPLATIEQAAIAEEALSAVRHDLRNRLATVRNAVYFIKRRLSRIDSTELDPRVMQFLDTIDNEMVGAEDALTEGRVARRFYAQSAPSASAADCVERGASLARNEGKAIRIDMDLEPGEVAISPEALTLLIRLLVENAIEASPDGSVVKIDAAPEESSFRIRIIDEGQGLPASAKTPIFDPFVSTKEGHIGVGLCVAGRSARQANGKLTVTPAPKGVIASVSLPLVTPSEARPDHEEAS